MYSAQRRCFLKSGKLIKSWRALNYIPNVWENGTRRCEETLKSKSTIHEHKLYIT